MHQLAVQRRGIVERAGFTPSRNSRLPAGQAGEAALALGPVAGRHVEQRLGQARSPSSRWRSSAAGMLVGEQELDAVEARLRGGVEPVEERHFVEHHRQVGGKTRHGGPPRKRGRRLEAGDGLTSERVTGTHRLGHRTGEATIAERILLWLLVGGIGVGCVLVLYPFFSALLWAAILVFTTWPVCEWLRAPRPAAARRRPAL